MSKKIYNLGKVKGRTPEFRLTEKILEIKYDDENTWSTLVDFSTIASSFDLRLNEETYFLEAQREVDGEWEPMVDLSALKLAHEHKNKAVLDKFTEDIFKQAEDTIKKKHTHDNLDVLNGVTEDFISDTEDAISKKHEHENIDSLDQIGSEQINNINKISVIKDDIIKLYSRPSLVEGIVYTENIKKGFSANRGACPTADYAWIEGNASNYINMFRYMGSIVLNIVTTTTQKSTKTTATIGITCENSELASNWCEKLLSTHPYVVITFDEIRANQYAHIKPNFPYYLKVTSATVSGETINLNFVFLEGTQTFYLEGNYSLVITSLNSYPINGIASHAEGYETIAPGDYSHVQGKYNVVDMENKYAHIVGNGTSDDNRSNAHTVDWEGNAWYAGKVSATNIEASLERDLAPLMEDLIMSKTYLQVDIEPLKRGSIYQVILNGIQYTETAKLDMDDFSGGAQIYYIGNLYLRDSRNEDTGEDFCIVYSEDLGNTTYIYVRESASVISLYIVETRKIMIDLGSYIQKLEARIKVLEEIQTTTTEG